MHPKKCKCGATVFDVGGFGVDFCTGCGLGCRGEIADTYGYVPKDRAMTYTVYTRKKRFRKYLMRANRTQSLNTVPQETWEYLLERKPYRDAGHVHQTLKRAKHLKKKCYDSLPFMCSHLCTGSVPRMDAKEIHRAMEYFDLIDRELCGQTMISYLFCLEYILLEIGRGDLVPFISRIKCEKRRRHYKERLDRMFQVGLVTPITTMLLRDYAVPL